MVISLLPLPLSVLTLLQTISWFHLGTNRYTVMLRPPCFQELHIFRPALWPLLLVLWAEPMSQSPERLPRSHMFIFPIMTMLLDTSESCQNVVTEKSVCAHFSWKSVHLSDSFLCLPTLKAAQESKPDYQMVSALLGSRFLKIFVSRTSFDREDIS